MKNTISKLLEKIELSQIESNNPELLNLNDELSKAFLGGRKTENGTCHDSTNGTCTNGSCSDSTNQTCTNATCFV